MTPEYRAQLTVWLRDDRGAMAFMETLLEVLHTCDDLTDGDIPVPTAQVQEVFWKMLIDLPRNPFYTAHFALLNCAIQLAFLNWQIANRLEVEDHANGKAIAFVLRDSYVDLITLCAWIVGGSNWALQVGQWARLDAGSEGMTAYLDNLTREHRQTILTGGG